jgi:ketopantoate reductase
MRIVVVSAGAIGGYFGGRLLELVATSPSLCAHGAPPSRSRSTTCCALAPRADARSLLCIAYADVKALRGPAGARPSRRQAV